MYANEERVFLTMIRELKNIGYGRMMQIISHEWFRHDPNGAQIGVTCYGLLKKRDRIAYETLAHNDPLFKD